MCIYIYIYIYIYYDYHVLESRQSPKLHWYGGELVGAQVQVLQRAVGQQADAFERAQVVLVQVEYFEVGKLFGVAFSAEDLPRRGVWVWVGGG
jgi:hypothetical protein